MLEEFFIVLNTLYYKVNLDSINIFNNFAQLLTPSNKQYVQYWIKGKWDKNRMVKM